MKPRCSITQLGEGKSWISQYFSGTLRIDFTQAAITKAVYLAALSRIDYYGEVDKGCKISVD
jgi:hypothetical protein